MYEKERKEKEELALYIKNQSKANHSESIQSKIMTTEENIQDLLHLANEELDRQAKIISELASRLDYLEGKNIRSMHEKELNQLKDFYSVRLGIAIDSLNNLKKH
jgi:hypothetical protein